MPDVPFAPAAAEFNVPGKAWLTTHQKDFAGVASSAIVFDPSSPSSSPRILLVQRAPDDSMPNLWELPGGAVDSTDATILAGCARELREETGLTARRIIRRVTEGEGGEDVTVFTNSRGTKIFCKFAFEVEVDEGEEVTLDEVEHQAWVWAAEEEVVKGMVGELRIPLTAAHVRRIIMEAFRLKKEDQAQ